MQITSFNIINHFAGLVCQTICFNTGSNERETSLKNSRFPLLFTPVNSDRNLYRSKGYLKCSIQTVLCVGEQFPKLIGLGLSVMKLPNL